MSDLNRPQSSQPVSPRPEYSRPMEHEAKEAPSKMPWVILAVIIVVLVIVGVLFRDKLFMSKNVKPAAQTSGSGYQAVFLTNGQVYFGKLSEANGDYPVLTDIYYLQVVQPPLQGTPAANQPAGTTAQPQISLVKLGSELHGPVDEMHISKSQILFYEDLKSDGQVVKAIESNKANPAK